MSSKSHIVVGLDIGTSNVSVVVVELSQAGPQILGFSQVPSFGLKRGVVVNIESTVAAISQAISAAETATGVDISSVYASIGGSHIKGANSSGVVAVKGKQISNGDIARVIDAAKAVTVPPDREILHVLPQEFVVDNQGGIKDPLGMSGVRLEASAHIITGAVSSAQNVVRCANRCGLAVKDIVYGPLAAAEAVITEEEKELGVCLLDIGGGTTDLIVYFKGAIWQTAVISVGGSHITGDIASGLRTPILAAEEIKIKHGRAHLSGVFDDEIIEVPSMGGRPARAMSKNILAEIIHPRLEEIFSLAKRELAKEGNDEVIAGGLVLTGGGSLMPGVADVAQGVFNLPVRLGTPLVNSGSLVASRPDMATAVGLGVHGSRTRGYSRINAQKHSLWARLVSHINEWFGDSEAV
jgi:cell division protein FtsA